MNVHWSRAGALALCASLLAAHRLSAVSQPPQPRAPEDLKYVTACAAAEPNTVDGFVTNQSGDPYVVNGEVRFTFQVGGTMSRPDVLVFVDAGVPTGQTTRVARARVAFDLRAGESCAFDVASSIRRSGS